MTVDGTLVGTGTTTVDGTCGIEVKGTITIVGYPGTVWILEFGIDVGK
jgi:hypothetical protein